MSRPPIVLVHGALGHLGWGRRLQATAEDRARVLAMDDRAAITNPRLLRHALMVLAVVIGTQVKRIHHLMGGIH